MIIKSYFQIHKNDNFTSKHYIIYKLYYVYILNFIILPSVISLLKKNILLFGIEYLEHMIIKLLKTYNLFIF